jgi:hypothetical protein
MTRFIVPPYLLAHLAAADTDRFTRAPEAARHGLMQIDEVRAARSEAPPVRQGAVARGREVERTVSDAQGTEQLPATTSR